MEYYPWSPLGWHFPNTVLEAETVIKHQHLITVLDGAATNHHNTFHREKTILLTLNHLLSRLYKELWTEWCLPSSESWKDGLRNKKPNFVDEDFGTNWLGILGQVTLPLWASVSYPVEEGAQSWWFFWLFFELIKSGLDLPSLKTQGISRTNNSTEKHIL